jgi:TonB family protein
MKIFILTLLIISSASVLIFAQDGTVKSYYGGDTLKSEINFSNNIREGAAKFYYRNGNLKEELNYVNGKVDGLVKEYYPSGKIKKTYVIENGMRNGPASLFDTSGVYIKDLKYAQGKLVKRKNTFEEKEPDKIAASKQSRTKDFIKVSQNLLKKGEETSHSVPQVTEEKALKSDPAYYLTAEVMPEPVGGMKKIMNKLVYPEKAKEDGIQGTVKVLAFIDEDGEVTHAEVVQGIGHGCDQSAKIAVFYTKFKPGLLKGKPVNVQMVIPVEFKLKEKKKNSSFWDIF